jgi:hypothetical protein
VRRDARLLTADPQPSALREQFLALPAQVSAAVRQFLTTLGHFRKGACLKARWLWWQRQAFVLQQEASELVRRLLRQGPQWMAAEAARSSGSRV